MPTCRVVLLNGPPSSGRSTLARALHEVLEPPHWYRSLDHFRQGYLDRHFDPARGPWWHPTGRPLFRALIAGYLGSVRAMALAGHHVLSEAVILPSTRELYIEALADVPVLLVGVRCPLHVAQERERRRTDRPRAGGVELDVPEFELVHSHGAYDVEVDTSTTEVDDAVALIRAAIAVAPVPGAFERLRRT